MLRFSKLALILAIVVGLMVAFSSSAFAWHGTLTTTCTSDDQVVVTFEGDSDGPTSGNTPGHMLVFRDDTKTVVHRESWKLKHHDTVGHPETMATFSADKLAGHGTKFEVELEEDSTVSGNFTLECHPHPTPTPTPSSTPKPTPTPTPSKSPSPTPSSSPSSTPTPVTAPPTGGGSGTPLAQTGSSFVTTGLFGFGFLALGLGIWFYRAQLLRLLLRTRSLIG